MGTKRLLIKEIESCVECDHAETTWLWIFGYFCTFSGKKTIPDLSGYSIPDWCPLEKVEKLDFLKGIKGGQL